MNHPANWTGEFSDYCLCLHRTAHSHITANQLRATGILFHNMYFIQSPTSIYTVSFALLPYSLSARGGAGLTHWYQSLVAWVRTTTFQTRMATAVCGLQSTGRNSKPAKTHREYRRKAKDSRRRQAALLFLNNISLDGRPQGQLSDGNTGQKADEEPRLSDRDGGSTVVPQPADSQAPVAQVTEPAAAGSGSSASSCPGVFSPARPSLVMSPGLTVGANEVFLEGGSAAETLTPDTPISPVPTGHQPCSRVRSTPAALSPVPASNSLDSRQRWAW